MTQSPSESSSSLQKIQPGTPEEAQACQDARADSGSAEKSELSGQESSDVMVTRTQRTSFASLETHESTGTDVLESFDEESADKVNEISGELTEDQNKAKARRKYLKKRSSGGINDHHLYRQFRLHMVESFGCLAAAFYEVEMKAKAEKGLDDEVTGKITQDDFKLVIHDKLQLFDMREIECLFRFVTDNTYLSEGVSGIASYKDFGIDEEEWTHVVERKIAERKGEKKSVFASTSSGQSTGLYHRSMDVDAIAKKAETEAKKGANVNNKRKTKSSWQKPQTGWQPSITAGGGPWVRLEDVVSRGRPRTFERTISTHGQSALRTTARDTKFRPSWPGPGFLGNVTRQRDVQEEAKCLQNQCPTRRNEMVLRTAAVLVVEPWWPYAGDSRISPERRRRETPQHSVTSRLGSRSAR
jgi:hypothetical protein